MLIGVVGLNGSGKDTFARYLVEKHGFVHRDLGKEVRDELERRGRNPQDRNEMIKVANEMRHNFGASYWCRKALEGKEEKKLVITSLRNPSEIEEIKARGGVVVEVYADARVRFERTMKRIKIDPSSHGDVKSFESFLDMEKKELENADPAAQQLLKCISMAEYRIDNNGSMEQLDKEVEGILERVKGKDARRKV